MPSEAAEFIFGAPGLERSIPEGGACPVPEGSSPHSSILERGSVPPAHLIPEGADPSYSIPEGVNPFGSAGTVAVSSDSSLDASAALRTFLAPLDIPGMYLCMYVSYIYIYNIYSTASTQVSSFTICVYILFIHVYRNIYMYKYLYLYMHVCI